MTQNFPAAILRNGLRVLAPAAVVLTVYLYLYPVFSTCAFPLPRPDGADTGLSSFFETAALHSPFPLAPADSDDKNGRDSRLAPFRLLALGDPQLEGDTSIPTTYLGAFPHFWTLASHLSFRTEQSSLRERVRQSLHDAVDLLLEDVPNTVESLRKRVDLFGNDFYLAHIARTLRWWARPTHVSVLGDLVGSQWLEDDEFFRRSDRYWSRVFRGAARVPDHVARGPAEGDVLAGILGGNDGSSSSEDPADWTKRIINVAGNHDIGYAGDINRERLDRFERAFGKANYELRFGLEGAGEESGDSSDDGNEHDPEQRPPPRLRIVVLNDMNLDTPAQSTELQDATYGFVNGVIGASAPVERRGTFTVVLTHVPLYKPPGICVDAPLFEFHEHDGTLREQNQLSADASRGFLEGIYGMSADPAAPRAGLGRPGVILNGHDHEGCDSWHYVNQTAWSPASAEKPLWEVMRWEQARAAEMVGRAAHPGVREITVRSMMGDFGGNAGLLSAWFDYESWQWRFEYAACPLGKQHLWWAVHVLDLITTLGALAYGLVRLLGLDRPAAAPRTLKAKEGLSPKDPGPAMNGAAGKEVEASS